MKPVLRTLGLDLAAHPFGTKISGVKTPGEVLRLYQVRAKEIDHVEMDQILVDWLLSIVCALYSLSGILGNTVSLVCGLLEQARTSVSLMAHIVRIHLWLQR